jgi:hypothetical protein
MKDNGDLNADTKVTVEDAVEEKRKELTPTEQEQVAGGAVNAYLIIDGRPGPSTSKAD